ncbi:hypothetical protein Q4555_02185 [Octadecabacter sp. 1_MG-2023]|uniref:hypothetical protein n=1 Tax=unclassified Octadecabacter TaxID=196158 RepID=UPI001C097712|nr:MULTISPECIES: hypothetical protein [unclassified Octadecabacter]MBU2993090.1 hypothetical protein [Octadecabacter sp. B2R22]MDO6733458.1 hypothetical protein [Octadecabacter sp. 1_MG-2023]
MADYDFSKPAPDRTHRVPIKEGSGMGGLGFMLVGAVIVLSVLYAVFGGSAAPVPNDNAPAAVATPSE